MVCQSWESDQVRAVDESLVRVAGGSYVGLGLPVGVQSLTYIGSIPV